jgi:tetratricopeptide (TPR) repeat protein
MKRLFVMAFAALILAGCGASTRLHRTGNPYGRPLFYAKYLTAGNPLDDQIRSALTALRNNPHSAPLHNQLGQLLSLKGFPKDAELEFERAVNEDRQFYPAWYNLALIRSARSDYMGARIAFGRVLHYKPGHSAALFQMGLMEERRGDNDAAIADYAKAFSINHALLDVKVNPQILDSKLVAYALIKAYPNEHTRESMLFQGTPAGYAQPGNTVSPPAPSPVAPTDKIVPPAAPVPAPTPTRP